MNFPHGPPPTKLERLWEWKAGEGGSASAGHWDILKLEYFVLYRDKELFQVPSYTETCVGLVFFFLV